jgi:hypothetical protein
LLGVSVIQLGITIASIKDAVEKVGGADNVDQHPAPFSERIKRPKSGGSHSQ